MIGFLRKIRRKLLIENKFSSYLIYALGEIVLIVIGILIAVGINNWNQDRLDNKKETFYLQGLKTEFERSRIKLKTLIDVNRLNYENSKQIAAFINSDTSTLTEQELSKLLFNAFSFEIAYNPNNSLLNELINSGELKNISNPQLRQHLTSWESFIQSIHNQEASLADQRERTVDIFRKEVGSIKTILDNAGVSSEMGLPPKRDNISNMQTVRSVEFENNLLMFLLTGMMTETNHYLPLMEEIDTILKLIEKEIK